MQVTFSMLFSPLAIIAFVIALIAALVVVQTIFALVLTAIARATSTRPPGTALILLPVAGGCEEYGKYDGEDLHLKIFMGVFKKVPPPKL